MTIRRFMFGLLATFLLASPVYAFFSQPGEGPTLEQRLREQLRKERRETALVKKINHRLVRAYMSNGPGYISPRQQEWECIAEEETHKTWDSDDNHKYKGGLQFDSQFERDYGREFKARFHGRANKWPKWAQIIAADRGHAARGYNPWPNTARRCGLL